MAKRKGIIAYGTDLDRQKLATLAHFNRCSSSEWIVEQIRSQYTRLVTQYVATTAPDTISV